MELIVKLFTSNTIVQVQSFELTVVIMLLVVLGILLTAREVIKLILAYALAPEAQEFCINMGGAQVALSAIRVDQFDMRKLNSWADQYETDYSDTGRAIYELIDRELRLRHHRFSRHF